MYLARYIEDNMNMDMFECITMYIYGDMNMHVHACDLPGEYCILCKLMAFVYIREIKVYFHLFSSSTKNVRKVTTK